jgi:cytochrome o ubiquinol oxidase operon protein cyoD
MNEHELNQPDYGTGEKKLSVYIFGVIACALLTIFSFWIVKADVVSKMMTFALIYLSACIQFLIQVICFLRLNTQTEHSRNNVVALIFTCIILTSIIVGSLWIMSNLNYNMMN